MHDIGVALKADVTRIGIAVKDVDVRIIHVLYLLFDGIKLLCALIELRLGLIELRLTACKLLFRRGKALLGLRLARLVFLLGLLKLRTAARYHLARLVKLRLTCRYLCIARVKLRLGVVKLLLIWRKLRVYLRLLLTVDGEALVAIVYLILREPDAAVCRVYLVLDKTGLDDFAVCLSLGKLFVELLYLGIEVRNFVIFFVYAVFVIRDLLVYRTVSQLLFRFKLAQTIFVLGLARIELCLCRIELCLLLVNDRGVPHHFLGVLYLLARLFELSCGRGLLLSIFGIAAVIFRLCRVILLLALFILRPCIVKLRHRVVDDAVIADGRALLHELFKGSLIALDAVFVFLGIHIALGVNAEVDLRVIIRRKAVGGQVDIALDAAVAESARAALDVNVQNALGYADYRVLIVGEGVKGAL